MTPEDNREVAVGKWVRIFDLGDEEEEVFYLVDESAADPARSHVSSRSRFAQAILGSKPGEVVSFTTPGGKANVKIVDTGKHKPR